MYNFGFWGFVTSNFEGFFNIPANIAVAFYNGNVFFFGEGGGKFGSLIYPCIRE
jgi:hypothetical protein